ncbi:DUF6221 family protein [Streptomyces atriruber]|uniref:DUF6221 family protein n=1 Tax=Streptomyces atriruber TaxID=545121 RepID=UPI0006E2965B|nr:DUF6221 family protein [Streptomyces atriruber]
MTAELIAFLRARLDGAVARASRWHDLECEIHTRMDGDLLAMLAAGRMLAEVPGAVCDCGGPARVLKEIEAKREMLRLYERACDHWAVFTSGFTVALEDVLRMFAAAYDDHPDHCEEFRP